jgi:hypothetical protein
MSPAAAMAFHNVKSCSGWNETLLFGCDYREERGSCINIVTTS